MTDAARPEASPYRGVRAAILVAMCALCGSLPLRAASLAVGQPFPSLTDFALEGTPPETAAAKVVIVDFWASWCPPCRAAFPVLEAVQADFGAQGVQVIAVSVDQNRGAMEAFLKRHPVTFAVLRDAGQKLVQRVDVPTMPTTYVLDARGIVRFVHAGFDGDATRDRLRAEIASLLEEKS